MAVPLAPRSWCASVPGIPGIVAGRLAVQPLAEPPEEPRGGGDLPGRQPVRDAPRPARLEPADLAEQVAALRRGSRQLRAPVVRVVPERHHALGREAVGDALHALPRQAHAARDLRDGEGLRLDGAEHLPAGAGQASRRGEAVARGEQAAIGPEDLEHQLGEGFRRGAGLVLGEQAGGQHDRMLSNSVGPVK